MQVGVCVTNYNWAGGAALLGETLGRFVGEAEQAGATRIAVMDHHWQIPEMGGPDDYMLEAYSTLGFIAAHTQRALIHTLVTGVIYRAPALVARMVATIDVLSGGRAGLGIGAGWNRREALGLGFGFPTTAERFERLEEAIRICRQMWSGTDEPFRGKHHLLERAASSPAPLSRPYVIIGGTGESRTLRIVAQHGDACNIPVVADAAHKLDVLRRHCDTLGRDYAEVERTTTLPIGPTTSLDDVLRSTTEAADRGFTAIYMHAQGPVDPGVVVHLLSETVQRVGART